MCKGDNVQEYRVEIRSGDKQYGNNNSGHYLVRLPFKINDGYVFVESLEITNAGTLFNGVNLVKVNCPSLTNTYYYSTSGDRPSTIESIPLMNDYKQVAAGSELYFKREVGIESIGYSIKNIDLDNAMLHIELKNETNTLLTEAQITDWTMTLLFVDHDAEKELM